LAVVDLIGVAHQVEADLISAVLEAEISVVVEPVGIFK
jgi:hypothetical protein